MTLGTCERLGRAQAVLYAVCFTMPCIPGEIKNLLLDSQRRGCRIAGDYGGGATPCQRAEGSGGRFLKRSAVSTRLESVVTSLNVYLATLLKLLRSPLCYPQPEHLKYTSQLRLIALNIPFIFIACWSRLLCSMGLLPSQLVAVCV